MYYNHLNQLYEQSLLLLTELIKIPRMSRSEDAGATLIFDKLSHLGLYPERYLNNVWVKSSNFNASKPTLLLNSHIDTIKPSESWTYNPYEPTIVDQKLYGLGSNDAGASLASMFSVFTYFNDKVLPYNIIYAATAEEEISGFNGIEAIWDKLGKIDFVVVGEPTQMQMAIAEKGLMVIDCVSKGISSHVAHSGGVNAIDMAIDDIHWLHTHKFDKCSDLLGAVKMTVTQINGGKQHNVIPDECRFVVDVRSNELYSNEELFSVISQNIKSSAKARSFRLNSSSIEISHPFVQSGLMESLTYYGSPTTSDQGVIQCKSIKMGPGDSKRSHTDDEFVFLEEIKSGIYIYINVLQNLKL